MEDGKMSWIGEFCKRKNIVFSAKRYGIDALGAMAQGLFCSLLIGTIKFDNLKFGKNYDPTKES